MGKPIEIDGPPERTLTRPTFVPVEDTNTEAAEANLAKDLAERLEREYRRCGINGFVPINRFNTTAVVADAIRAFEERHDNVTVPVAREFCGPNTLVARFAKRP